MKAERYIERVMEGLSMEPRLMRRPRYAPGRCSICFKPKEACWDTGDKKPETKDAATSAKGNQK